MTQIVFLILPGVEILDLAGPVQTFFEANELGANYTLRYCSTTSSLTSAQGLSLTKLELFSDVDIQAGDFVFIPGLQKGGYTKAAFDRLNPAILVWLKTALEREANICSVCTGAFLLAYAGLLDGRASTTHWNQAERLQKAYPKVNVLKDRLFVKDNNLYSSAGIASGIDLSLSILEDELGPLFTVKVARSLVVYLRRDGTQQQQSIYLSYRSHLNPLVHQVQDWLINHPGQKISLEQLADLHHLSPRHLTRIFKKATGITINEYATQIKVEYAQSLLRNPQITIEMVAQKCGFKDARQLRRLWQNKFNASPSNFISS
ncbi:MAG: DJ-1/PfpI family protein [Ardenticatenaceae bacterium]|nr:DJ-1/PfpI family protein [Ardenticatenaceae bacterium]